MFGTRAGRSGAAPQGSGYQRDNGNGSVGSSQNNPSTPNGLRVTINKRIRGPGALNTNGHVNQNPIKLPIYAKAEEADDFSELLSGRAHHNLESQAHLNSRVYSSTPEWGNAVLTNEPMKAINKALYQRAVRSTPMSSSLQRDESSPPWLTFATQQNSTQITALKNLIKDGLRNDANFQEFNLINVRPEDIKFDYVTPENGFSLPNVAVKNEPENPRLYGVFSVGAGTEKRQFKFLLSWDNLPARENGHHEEAFGRVHPGNNGNAVANGVPQRDELQPPRSGGEDGPSRVPAESPGQNNGLPNHDLNGSRRLPLEDESYEEEASFNGWNNGFHPSTGAAGRTGNTTLEEEFPQDPDLIQQNPSPSQNGRSTFDEQSTRSSLLGGSRIPVVRAQTSRTPLVDGLGPGFGFGDNSSHLSPGLFSNSSWGSRTGRGSFNQRSSQTPSPFPGTLNSQQPDSEIESQNSELTLSLQEITVRPPVPQPQPGLTLQSQLSQPQEQDLDEDPVSPPVSPESQPVLSAQSQSARPDDVPLELQKREEAPPSTPTLVDQTPPETQRKIEFDTTGSLASNFFARR